MSLATAFLKTRSKMRFRLLQDEGQNRHFFSGIRLVFCVRLKLDLNRALRAIIYGKISSMGADIKAHIIAYSRKKHRVFHDAGFIAVHTRCRLDVKSLRAVDAQIFDDTKNSGLAICMHWYDSVGSLCELYV